MIKNKMINMLFILFMFVGSVEALSSFPESFTTKTEGEGITLNNNHSLQIDTSQSASSDHYYPYFHVKNSSAGNIICVSGLGVNEPVANLTCSKVSWSSTNQAKGVAYIINTIIGEGGSATVSNEKYFWTEVLINAYLGTYTPSSSSYMNNYVINAGVKIAGTGKSYNEILNGAQNYASTSHSVSLNATKTNLTFTKNSDGYYYSDPVTITSTTSYKFSNLSNSKFSYDKDGDVYTFKIKSSDIALGESESFSITVSNSGKEYYTAQRYDCGSGYQDLTLSQTVKSTTSADSIKISGSVSKSTVQIKVAKVNSNNKFISGAKLHFQTESERNDNSTGKIITSTTGYTTITNLKSGVYYLTEKEAPSGYDLSKQVIKIVIDNNGVIKVDGTTSDGSIRISNDLTKVEITKIDSDTNKPLVGAVLQVLDSKGNPILDSDGNELYKWTTTENKYTISGLAVGKYQLKEIKAPSGYVLNKNIKTFEVKGDGTVTKVTMENTKNRVVINKINMANGKLLPGATLEIQDSKGNIVKYCKDSKGNDIECRWESTDVAYEIEGMPNGKYYLVEKTAPSGYVLNTEKVPFTVDGKNSVITVKMENIKNRVVINKINMVDGKLLPGSTLEIQDSKGNIVKYCKDSKGNDIECRWESTDVAYEIEGMPNGTYYLVEKKAPLGYVLNTEKVPFVVNGKDAVIEVKMENALEVKVPNTLSSRSALFLAIAMLDIAFGIGIITYVKKNKI